MSVTSQKVALLKENHEDYEFYPTTPEIIEAMKKDLWAYIREHPRDYGNRRGEIIYINESVNYDGDKKKKTETLVIGNYLDIGAGDGRVLDAFDADKKYGIEIARAQADDLIRRGVFIIGRNYWDVSLHNNYYSLVYSNPPFSQFDAWVNKILIECNFYVLYLVMPVRWRDKEVVTRELKRYDCTVVGEFDFSEADREARGKVHLVRVNARWKKEDGVSCFGGKRENVTYDYQETIEDSFDRWVREYIADFPEEERMKLWEEEHKQELVLKQTPIDQLISDYEREKENLWNAFQAIGKLEPYVIKLMGQDKKSMLEIIRKAIEGLKSKYWRAAFDKLDPVRGRMTHKTREKIFRNIEEFKSLDFNGDNIYSIIIWIINNCNVGILDQIGEVFDALATPQYVEAYKSNKHWTKGDWRHTERSWKYEKLPPRWKLGLDYRIVVETHNYDSYRQTRHTVVDDFIVICRNLGFQIRPCDEPNYGLHQAEQKFYTCDDELAFTMRYYTGNQNAHLKINKKLLMKFNVEVAKIRKWLLDPDDVAEEFEIPKDEATRMWNSGLALLGAGDVKMLEFKE